MNDEQKIKLPLERDDFLLKVLKEKKLCYLRGLGIIAVIQVPKRVTPPAPGIFENGVTIPEHTDFAFVWVPSDEYMQTVLAIDSRLEIVEFDVRDVIKTYKPNTGLTVFVDKKNRKIFRFNYRVEVSGETTCKLLGIQKEYSEKLLREVKPSCRITKESKKVIFTKL